METQNELFPLPKKQKSLFGNSKGTVLGELPVESRQSTSKISEREIEPLGSLQAVAGSGRAEIREANIVRKPRYHRCDPNKPPFRRFVCDDETKRLPLTGKLDDGSEFIEKIFKEQREGEPLTDDANEPLLEVEEMEPIQVLGQVIHIDPTHQNPYEQKATIWQLIRQFFQTLFNT